MARISQKTDGLGNGMTTIVDKINTIGNNAEKKNFVESKKKIVKQESVKQEPVKLKKEPVVEEIRETPSSKKVQFSEVVEKKEFTDESDLDEDELSDSDLDEEIRNELEEMGMQEESV